jgi:hypothetical protein
MCTEICGVSQASKSCSVVGASDLAEKSANALGPGYCVTFPFGLGKSFATVWSSMAMFMFSWLNENAGRWAENVRGT